MMKYFQLTNDPITLTVGRLLVWWFETQGLFEEPIYGIPSTDFYLTNTFYPQVTLHFRERKYEAAINNRRPARSKVSFRWREDNYSTTNINALATKVKNDFAIPPFHYKKGRLKFSYIDHKKGYFFIVAADTEVEAKSIIAQVYGIQDTGTPDWESYLRESKSNENFTVQQTITVMGKTYKKPKKRPIAEVYFQWAELNIPGLTKPIILVDRTGTKAGAIKLA